MTNSRIPQVVAAIAAFATTLVVFSAVVSLADQDKAALVAAKVKPTAIAQSSERVYR
jgi:hypothetical protein